MLLVETNQPVAIAESHSKIEMDNFTSIMSFRIPLVV